MYHFHRCKVSQKCTGIWNPEIYLFGMLTFATVCLKYILIGVIYGARRLVICPNAYAGEIVLDA